MGYRGDEIILPKPQEDFRIVCIGGSTTYTIFTGYREAYPSLLEEQLVNSGYDNVQVVNAGVPGWSTWESMINFQLRVLEIEPDMIIVCHAINDVYPRFVWPPEAFRSDNSGYRIPRENAPDSVHYSCLLRIFAVRFGLAKPAMDLAYLDSHAKTYVGDDYHAQKWNGTFPKGLFGQIPPTKIMEENDLKYFRRNLENMIMIAQSRGINVVLATFAHTLEFEDPVKDLDDVIHSGIDEANRELKAIARDTGVLLFDFAELFPTEKQYFVDSSHVNQEGSTLKARLFADFIHQSDLIPGRANLRQP
ncbi:MAG: SGNH/GDSL hydrolase family protein [Planctomycetota bacterium]